MCIINSYNVRVSCLNAIISKSVIYEMSRYILIRPM